MKPRLVKGEEPKLTICDGLTARLLNDSERYSSGSMLMRLADSHITVSDGGKEIGGIGMALGGTFYIHVNGHSWAIDPKELFETVLKCDNQQYLKNGV